jgi:hypothetical protein
VTFLPLPALAAEPLFSPVEHDQLRYDLVARYDAAGA